jgi:hypothetical protein
MGQSLYNCCLAYSGLANKAGIVFGAPAEDLNDPLDLFMASDNRVKFPFSGCLG